MDPKLKRPGFRNPDPLYVYRGTGWLTVVKTWNAPKSAFPRAEKTERRQREAPLFAFSVSKTHSKILKPESHNRI